VFGSGPFTRGVIPGRVLRAVSGKGWTAARALATGDRLRTIDGHVAMVLGGETLSQRTRTFNFEVEAEHDYFVGTEQVLVHNASKLEIVADEGAGEVTSRAARRTVMREQGIPTSQQPASQSRNASGRSYEYEVPKPGGGTQTKSVQQQTMDRSHPGQSHWEAGPTNTDPVSGETRLSTHGRPKLTNQKSKANYDD
jgi:hypothetical protein